MTPRAVVERDRIPLVVPIRAIRGAFLILVLMSIVAIGGATWSAIRSSQRDDLRHTERELRSDLHDAQDSAALAADSAEAAESEVTDMAASIRDARSDSKELPEQLRSARAKRSELRSTLTTAKSAAH
jgi:hypothetical protein